MKLQYYRALLIRAVEARDTALLDQIAIQLEASEQAHSILRFKGYGMQGMMIDATARQVPTSLP